jgi:hypothetical protein
MGCIVPRIVCKAVTGFRSLSAARPASAQVLRSPAAARPASAWASRRLQAGRPRTRPSPPKPRRRSPPHPPEPSEGSRGGTNGPRPAFRKPPAGRLRPCHPLRKPPAGCRRTIARDLRGPPSIVVDPRATFRSPPRLRSRSSPSLPKPLAGSIPKRAEASETLRPLATNPARTLRRLPCPRHGTDRWSELQPEAQLVEAGEHGGPARLPRSTRRLIQITTFLQLKTLVPPTARRACPSGLTSTSASMPSTSIVFAETIV